MFTGLKVDCSGENTGSNTSVGFTSSGCNSGACRSGLSAGERKMSITETPLLSPEASDKFLAQVERDEKIPSGPVPTPRLKLLDIVKIAKATKLLEDNGMAVINHLTEHYIDCGYDHEIAKMMAKEKTYSPR